MSENAAHTVRLQKEYGTGDKAEESPYKAIGSMKKEAVCREAYMHGEMGGGCLNA